MALASPRVDNALEKHRRAPNYANDFYSYDTLRTYRGVEKHFRTFASHRGFEATLATPDQILAYLRLRNETLPIKKVRQDCSGISAFFRRYGVPDGTLHPDVDAFFEQLRDNEDYAVTGASPALAQRRARWFADQAYRPSTAERYGIEQRKWTRYADERGLDAKRPTLPQYKRYLERLAEIRTYCTVRNINNALGALFRQNGAPDLSRCDDVQRFLDELKRSKAPKPSQPIYSEVAVELLADLDPRVPLDARDAVIALLAARAGVTRSHLQRLDRSRVKFGSSGRVTFFTDIPRRRTIHVDVSKDPRLDIRPWIKALLAFTGITPGPLILGLTNRGAASGEPLGFNGIECAMRNLARRAGLPSKSVTLKQLRKGFIIRVGQRFGRTVAAEVSGLRAPAMKRYGRFLGKTYWQQRMRNARRRKRWSARPR